MKKEIFVLVFASFILICFGGGFLIGGNYQDTKHQDNLIGMAYAMANATYECSDDDGNMDISQQFHIKSTAIGENGEFTDHCEDSDLKGVREYFCATDQVQSILKGCNCIDGACIE